MMAGTQRLRVEIVNERLLPRFGVDRILVLLGRRLERAGHAVSFACLRTDPTMLEGFAGGADILDIPPGLDIAGTEAHVAQRMAERWRSAAPDVVVCGGWPFFGAAAAASRQDVRSIFIDAGAVAQDGLPEPLLTIQRELRRVRQLALSAIDRILPISDFIRTSQTEPDRGSAEGVRTVLLGADHMAADATPSTEGRDLLARLDAWRDAGERLILALGRFEAVGYKNSPAAYEVLRRILGAVPRTRLLLLDAGGDCAIPPDLAPMVETLGAPDDATLREVMRRCDLGLSTSRWEGFNLPVAEMQWLSRPALAFNLGAHPEVIADPWLLCRDDAEMAAKGIVLLQGEAPLDLGAAFEGFRRRRRWETTLSAWQEAVEEVAAAPRRAAAPQPLPLLVDVTYASLDPANPGVIRVVRRLSAELQRQEILFPIFVRWDAEAGTYDFLDATRRGFLEGYSGPRDGFGAMHEWGGKRLTPERLLEALGGVAIGRPMLLLPEVLFDGQAGPRFEWARRHGFGTAAILHDLIPIDHPELCDPAVVSGFPDYVRHLAAADLIWSVSDFSLGRLRDHLRRTGQAIQARAETLWLPGQFGNLPRVTEPPAASEREIRILCVSTLEPRKNHRRLLAAFRDLRLRRPELRLRLVLVGNRYAGAPDLAAEVEQACRADERIVWRRTLSDTELAAEYAAAAFTVYPSLVEGFGLPILESLWLGRPCLSHAGGVMQELAKSGGCVTADMTDPAAISRELERLATNPALRAELTRSALARPIRDWPDYARTVAERLAEHVGGAVPATRRAPLHELAIMMRAGAEVIAAREPELAAVLDVPPPSLEQDHAENPASVLGPLPSPVPEIVLRLNRGLRRVPGLRPVLERVRPIALRAFGLAPPPRV